MALMPASAGGAHDNNAPLVALNAASLERATPFAVLKEPPTYTVVFVATIARMRALVLAVKVVTSWPVAVL